MANKRRRGMYRSPASVYYYRHMRAAVLILRGIQIAFPRGGAGASVSKLN